MPKRKNAPMEEDGTKPLANKRHEAFCMHYVGDCRDNASASCIAAGYSGKNADVVGPRLLVNVGIQRRIRHLEDELVETEKLRMIDAVRHLKSIATVNLSDFLNEDGTVDESKFKDPWLMQAVQELSPVIDRKGHRVGWKIKLKDSMRALELLGLTDQKAAPDQNNQILVIKV